MKNRIWIVIFNLFHGWRNRIVTRKMDRKIPFRNSIRAFNGTLSSNMYIESKWFIERFEMCSIFFLTEFISSSSSWSLTSDWSSTYVTWLFSLCTSTNLSSIASLLSSSDRSLSIKSYHRHYLWNIQVGLLNTWCEKLFVLCVQKYVRMMLCTNYFSPVVRTCKIVLLEASSSTVDIILSFIWDFNSLWYKRKSNRKKKNRRKCWESWATSFIEEVWENINR